MLFRQKAKYAAGCILIGVVLVGCGGLTGSHTKFSTGDPVSVQVDPTSITLQVGTSETLVAKALDNRGLEVSGAQFTWSVFNPLVATVDTNGKVTAVAPGITSVSAICNGLIARADVTVTAGAVELSFDRDIKTLAALGCACHQPGGTAASTGSMADLSNIKTKGYVVPGDPAGSPYVTVGGGGGGHPGGDVWGANKQKVMDWIEQGAKP